MTTMTLAPASTLHPDSYYAGRADAHDEAPTVTLDELRVRAAAHTDLHHDLWYAIGYTARVNELRLEDAAVASAEMELAHADRPSTRRHDVA